MESALLVVACSFLYVIFWKLDEMLEELKKQRKG